MWSFKLYHFLTKYSINLQPQWQKTLFLKMDNY